MGSTWLRMGKTTKRGAEKDHHSFPCDKKGVITECHSVKRKALGLMMLGSNLATILPSYIDVFVLPLDRKPRVSPGYHTMSIMKYINFAEIWRAVTY